MEWPSLDELREQGHAREHTNAQFNQLHAKHPHDTRTEAQKLADKAKEQADKQTQRDEKAQSEAAKWLLRELNTMNHELTTDHARDEREHNDGVLLDIAHTIRQTVTHRQPTQTQQQSQTANTFTIETRDLISKSARELMWECEQQAHKYVFVLRFVCFVVCFCCVVSLNNLNHCVPRLRCCVLCRGVVR